MKHTYETSVSSNGRRPTYLELYGDATLSVNQLEELADTDPAFFGFEIPPDHINLRTGDIDFSQGTLLETSRDKQDATRQFIARLAEEAKSIATELGRAA